MKIQQKLYWLIHMGVTHFCAETPHNIMQPAKVNKDTPATVQASMQAVCASTLSDLNDQKNTFELSALKKMASHTLLGQGPAQPQLMCVFEMPSADSDRSGQILAGSQGEMFQKMMTAIHLDIIKDVYVTYLCPWRTPGNRPLTEAEQALFLPFLQREIELVKPKKILLFGSGIATPLLKTESLSKARNCWHNFHNIPTRVTLSLSSLKTTALKRQAWQDLQEVIKEI